MLNLKRKLIMALSSLLMVGVLTVGAYFYGRTDGGTDCEVKQLRVELKGVDRHEDIEQEIMGMDVPALNHGLSRWLRPDDTE